MRTEESQRLVEQDEVDRASALGDRRATEVVAVPDRHGWLVQLNDRHGQVEAFFVRGQNARLAQVDARLSTLRFVRSEAWRESVQSWAFRARVEEQDASSDPGPRPPQPGTVDPQTGTGPDEKPVENPSG